MAVTIEIRHIDYIPANRQSWTERPARINIVVHVPYRRLPRAPVIEHEVWFVIVVKVIG